MKKNLRFVVLTLLLATGLGAQTLTVDYVDGTVEVKTSATAWKPLSEGAKLTPDSVVRLADGGVAEVSSGTGKLHLAKDGVYQLSAVLAQGLKKTSTNLTTLTANKIDKLLNGPKARVEVADLGARGAAMGTGDSLEWAEEEDSLVGPEPQADPRSVLETSLDNQDWPGALTAVNRLLTQDSPDRSGLLVTKARILAAQGRAAAALKAVREAAIPRGQAHYMESVLLVASQGLETQEYDLVLSSTASALTLNPDTEILQSLTLAQALAWQAKGDAKQAKTLLANVVKLGDSTPAGKEAARLSSTF